MKQFVMGLMLVVTLCAVACKIADIATPEQKQQLAVIDSQLETQKAETADTERLSAELLKSVKTAADMQSKMAELEALSTKWKASAEKEMALEKQAMAVEDEAISGVTGPLAPIGPYAPYLPLIQLAVPLLFDRPRKHLITAGQRLLKGGVADFVSYIAKAYGLKHSSYDPVELHQVAIDVALKKGDLATAVALEPALKNQML